MLNTKVASSAKKWWQYFTDHFGATPIHPQFIIKHHAQLAVVLAKKHIHGNLLDIGCGTMSYKKHIEPFVDKYTGLDYPLTSKNYKSDIKPDVFGDARSIPLKSNSFDSVLMLQVLEHIDNPVIALKEAYRVLKKGKYFILSVPFMYPIHDEPNDFFRYTQFALRKLLISSNFEVLGIYTRGSFLEFWLQSLVVSLFKTTQNLLESKLTFSRLLQLLLFAILLPIYLPINLAAITVIPLLERLFTKHPNSFPLIYVAVARKPK